VRALLAIAFAVASLGAHQAWTIEAPTPTQKQWVTQSGNYKHGCPVGFSKLRVLTVRFYGFDRKTHTGQILINEQYAPGLRRVFQGLYKMRFPIRHMDFRDTYGGPYPTDGDTTASFECRQAAASPCTGGRTGSWSNHAYGLAVDLDPLENPYVGCGQTRDKLAVSYMNRSKVRPGMVTPAVIRLFASIGWGWGGSWAGGTKDYMHFSYNGH
jgi:hypothetical protein